MQCLWPVLLVSISVYLVFAHFMVIIIADIGHGNVDARRRGPDP